MQISYSKSKFPNLNSKAPISPHVVMSLFRIGIKIHCQEGPCRLSPCFVPQNEDAGDYKCVATNDVGVVERSLTLTLQSKAQREASCPLRE